MAFVALALPLSPARADFELTAPDGRQILLKNDGTWRYVEPGGKPAEDKGPESGEAVLSLIDRKEYLSSCQYTFELVNNLPYEIRTIVPFFVAYRANGVAYNTVSANFNEILPGNSRKKSVTIEGITCKEITRLQVTRGDRCNMGELDRYSATEGQCLARVRVVESNLVQFDK